MIIQCGCSNTNDAGEGQETTLSFGVALTTCKNGYCIVAWWMWSNKLTECIIILVNNHISSGDSWNNVHGMPILIVKPNRDSFQFMD